MRAKRHPDLLRQAALPLWDRALPTRAPVGSASRVRSANRQPIAAPGCGSDTCHLCPIGPGPRQPFDPTLRRFSAPRIQYDKTSYSGSTGPALAAQRYNCSHPETNMPNSSALRRVRATRPSMPKSILASLIILAVCAAVLFSQSAPNPPVVTGNARVDKLLSQMTLEEKIALLHGGTEASPSGVGQAGTWPGLPRLGIPSLRLTDGPPGVSINIWSTGMTATMGLAATWSRDDARKNGIVIGRDARALGQDVVLQPFVNLVRDFEFGRAYNTSGEDPFLTGQIASAQVQGTQGEGVMSQAKHFIGYDGGNDVYVDPQTLREIYIAPFVDLANAGVSSIMCSYNKINGLQACDNNEIQNTIFRGEDGFRGFNTSDWGAAHGTMNIANGLDMEMPSGSYSAAEPGGRGMGGGGRGAAPAGAVPAAAAPGNGAPDR